MNGDRQLRLGPLRLLACLVLLATPASRAEEQHDAPVTVEEDRESFTLSNGFMVARVLKSNGDLRSLEYRGTELFTDRSGHAGGYWSHDTTGGKETRTAITIDPAGNGGAQAEVSVKGISGGTKMGHGPGAGPDGNFPADIEIRYTLNRDQPGIYTYCIFDHLPEYGAASMTEARFAAKLAEFFDWMSIDEKRNLHYPRVLPGEDKYVYTAVQSENRAFGFSSTTRQLGFYIINPTIEYLSGGPTKPEFLCHRDTTRVQAPVVLNYWRSSHYGGADVTVGEGERWTKVVGPFLLYANEGAGPMALWNDALGAADREAEKWPYPWVDAGNYAKPAERGSVTGRLVLDDPLVGSLPGRFLVGLVHEPYEVPGRRGRPTTITWQRDAKFYQFWETGAGAQGHFTIPNVTPGTYLLCAIADGVLGEFSRSSVVVGKGEAVELGELTWKPERHGRQLWEIGVPNRTSTEFAGGDRFFEPDITLQYAKQFPDDVDFTIGESDPSKDWFFAHVPHNTDPGARVSPFRGVRGTGRDTPYTVRFSLPETPRGTATLRFAICGTGTRSLHVSVNGESAGEVTLGIPDGVITRHQAQGIWYERKFSFAASRLHKGDNTLTLTVPAGPVNNGVVYDYLRLEMDEEPATENPVR